MIRSQRARGNATVVDAHAPLKEMFGYIAACARCLLGRAQYSMQFDHFSVAPASVATELLAA